MAEQESSEPASAEKKQYPVKRICAWCGKELGIAEYTSTDPNETTGGQCDDCLNKMREEVRSLDLKDKK